MTVKVKIMNAIISYPVLYTPRCPKGSTTPRFGATIILPDGYVWDEIQQAVATVTAEKWGTNPPANLKSQISVVGEGPYKGRYCISTTASVEHQPTVVDQSLQAIMNAGDIFAGCICNFQITVFAYETGSSGVSMGLNMVQLVQNTNVQRLDNTQSVEDVFAVIPGGAATGGQPPVNQGQPPMQQQQQPNPAMQQQPQVQQPNPAMQQQPQVQQQNPTTQVMQQQQPVMDQQGIVNQPVAAQQVDPNNPPPGMVNGQTPDPWT